MDKFRVGVIGAETKKGAQLCRLISSHPYLELAAVCAGENKGRMLSFVHPQLRNICDITCVERADVISCCDVVFSALPTEKSDALCVDCVSEKCVFIDLSECFHPEDEKAYEAWFGIPCEYPGLHNKAVYGLPELLRSDIVGKVIISVPCAAPAAAALAMAPSLIAGMLYEDSIVVTKIASPEHEGGEYEDYELEQILSRMAGTKVTVAYTDQRVRGARGVTVVCAAKMRAGFTQSHFEAAFSQIYRNEPFLRVMRHGEVSTANVLGSNITDISVRCDERTNMAVFTAALDDRIKGSAGLALQAMNVMLSEPETLGLELLPEIE